MENKELQFPWGIDETISNLQDLRDIWAEKLISVNREGRGEEDATQLMFDFNRAISALRFQKEQFAKTGQDYPPIKIGDDGYMIRSFRGGKESIIKGKVSEVYYLKNWRENEPERPMVLCAVVKGAGRGIVGEKVFATQEEAQKKLVEVKEA